MSDRKIRDGQNIYSLRSAGGEHTESGPMPKASELDEAAIKQQVGNIRVLIGFLSQRAARWVPERLLRPLAKKWAKDDGLPSQKLAGYNKAFRDRSG